MNAQTSIVATGPVLLLELNELCPIILDEMMAAGELDKLIAQGLAVKGSRVDLVHSKIGMVVRSGQPKPDISSKESFERTLLDAKSIGYSASASGVHLVDHCHGALLTGRRAPLDGRLLVPDHHWYDLLVPVSQIIRRAYQWFVSPGRASRLAGFTWENNGGAVE